MNEHLLQYIWLHRFFNTRGLQTEDKQSVILLHQGEHNRNQGPDFLHARIHIGGVELIGSVEIHVKTSHWYQHAHTGDPHYNNVILHVVWENDVPFECSIPVLSLQGRIPLHIQQHYEVLMKKNKSIPCASQIHSVKPLIISMWKERMFAERLTIKTEQISHVLLHNKQHEEEGFWHFIFRAMGMPVNSDAFTSIFLSVSFKIWLQSSTRIQVMEAILLGQAGLLNEDFEDHYLTMLKKEYEYICRKYDLKKTPLLLSYLRMRPSHFPVIRLAQLAMMMHQYPDLYTKMMECTTAAQMKNLLMVTANDFWHRHYGLKEESVYREKNMGESMASLILVNVVFPFLYVRASEKRNIPEQLRVMEYFTQIKSERNHIINLWQQLGIGADHAFDSQALLHLHNNYCQQKKCLECAIGREILKVGS